MLHLQHLVYGDYWRKNPVAVRVNRGLISEFLLRKKNEFSRKCNTLLKDDKPDFMSRCSFL